MANPPKKPQAHIAERKNVFNGFFKVDELTIDMDKHEGGTQRLKRLVFERGHAVTILAHDPASDTILLVNEMRPGTLSAGKDAFTDSLIAGMIDKGEDALTAAQRETLEETGMALQNARLIHNGAFVSPGGTSESIALVYGTVDMSRAGGVHGHAGEGEDIKSVIISGDEFIARAVNGELNDLKTLAMAFWFANNRATLKSSHTQPVSKKDGPKP